MIFNKLKLKNKLTKLFKEFEYDFLKLNITFDRNFVKEGVFITSDGSTYLNSNSIKVKDYYKCEMVAKEDTLLISTDCLPTMYFTVLEIEEAIINELGLEVHTVDDTHQLKLLVYSKEDCRDAYDYLCKKHARKVKNQNEGE